MGTLLQISLNPSSGPLPLRCARGQGDNTYGANLPAARRNSPLGIAPSRTNLGIRSVQSTSVDGGTLPRTPPSRTSSSPLRTASPNSSTSRSAPGAGGPPGRLAEVEVSGLA